jgi:hypothetical protein
VHRDGAKQIRLVEFTSAFVEPQWCEKGPYSLVRPALTRLAR